MTKADRYYEFLNRHLLDALPRGAVKFLDVGCASGLLGAAIKERDPSAVVHGIEREPRAARRAADRLDRVFEGDLEVVVPEIGETYDCIVCGDVLEHLLDPWSALSALTGLLAGGGLVAASIPNIRFYKVLREIVFKGRFEYREFGVLDSTHLRFFTLREMRKLFLSAGLTVTEERPIVKGKNVVMRVLDALAFRRLTEFRAMQYVIVGRRDGPSET